MRQKSALKIAAFRVSDWWRSRPRGACGGINLFNTHLSLEEALAGTEIPGCGGKRDTIPNTTLSPPRMSPGCEAVWPRGKALGW